jgi:RNA polymerase sigma-70 factor (ECF subfamily)
MGDNNAFTAGESHEALYRELFTPLFRYFVFRTKDKDVAEDLTQSTFLKFLLQDNRPEEKLHATRLLYTIARTLLIDHYRANARRPVDSLETSNIDPASSEQSAEAAYSISEDIAYAKELLRELTDTEEEIVILRIIAEMEYADIAQMTGNSEDNTRQIYSRALRKLRQRAEESPHSPHQ